MKPEDYPTTHQIARRLLEMPDVVLIFPMPIPEMQQTLALPVDLLEQNINGVPCVQLIPMVDTARVAEPQEDEPSQ